MCCGSRLSLMFALHAAAGHSCCVHARLSSGVLMRVCVPVQEGEGKRVAPKVPKGGPDNTATEGGSLMSIILPAIAIAGALAWKFYFSEQQ